MFHNSYKKLYQYQLQYQNQNISINVSVKFHIDTNFDMYSIIWMSPSLTELTPYQISVELTHLGSETSISSVKCQIKFHFNSSNTLLKFCSEKFILRFFSNNLIVPYK